MFKVLLCVVAGCLPLCEGYPRGPPVAACGKQIPNHGIGPRMSDPPYKITVSSTTYKPSSGNVTVTIEAMSSYFDGFFIQARRADCTQNETAVGRFVIDENDQTIKLLNCQSNNSAVCHANNSRKTRKSFVWINPGGQDVYFRSTFVKLQREFWINVESLFVMDATLNSGKTYMSCNGNRTRDSAASPLTSSWTAPLLAFILSARLA